MKEVNKIFSFTEYNSIDELEEEDRQLLQKAIAATENAYAPYSNFLVGAAARLHNLQIVTGTNQENASFPAGICAERVLLSAAASLFPKQSIQAIAITCINQKGENNQPVYPCGICRQSLAEYETRFNNNIQLILGGAQGKVHVIKSATELLPFSFTSKDLN